MTIKIDPLDQSFKDKDASLWYGERVLLKIEESRSPLIESNKEIRKLINQKLLGSSALEKLNLFQVLIRRIEEGKSTSVELASHARRLGFIRSGKVDSYFKGEFARVKGVILEASDGFLKLDKEFGATLSEPHILVFCGYCNAFLGEEGDPGFTKVCKVCKTDSGKGEKKGVHYPDSEVSKYLEGYWFEDYVAKFLGNSGWRVRTGTLVMGSSGVSHEIDILAFKENFTIVGECKTEKEIDRESVFNFVTKASDVGGNIMPLFSLNAIRDEESREFLRKKPGFKLIDSLASSGDSGLSESIKNIGKFSII